MVLETGKVKFVRGTDAVCSRVFVEEPVIVRVLDISTDRVSVAELL